MKDTLKKIVKVICFVTIVLFIGNGIYQVLLWKDTSGVGGFDYKHFYETEDNTIDVLFYGSSHSQCTINSAILYDKYGIVSNNLSAGGQSLSTTYYSMLESLKTQKPEVMVVELVFTSWEKDTNIGNIYRNTVNLKYSSNFFENVNAIVPKEQQEDVILKWPVFHTRYKEITKQDFVDDKYFNRGYCGSWVIAEQQRPSACDDTKLMKIGEDKEIVLQKMIDLAKENDIQLLFYVAPFILTETNQEKFNYVEDFCEKQNVEFINFNSISISEQIGLDYTKDFREESHLNNYGSEKVTEYIGEILTNNYEVTQRKKNSKYILWDENLKSWNNDVCNNNIKSSTNIDEFSKMMPDKGYTVIYYLPMGTSSSIQKDCISSILGEELKDKSCIVIDDGQKVYDSMNDGDNWNKDIDKYTSLYVYLNENEVYTIIDSNTVDIDESSVNIVIYDKINRLCVGNFTYNLQTNVFQNVN